MWPAPVTLRGRSATLELLDPRHAADLAEAADDGELHRLWYTTIPKPEGVEAEIARRLGLMAKGTMLPFAVLDDQGPSD